MSQDKIIVITLNYNQNQYTLDCINSLLKSDYSNFEVLLIDNGSLKENVEYLEQRLPADSRLKLQKIYPNRGYVGGINYGLESGRNLNPDYFLIMNNDTIIDPTAISSLVAACKKHNNKAIITGKVYHYDEPNKIQDIGYHFKDNNLLTCIPIGLNENDVGQYDDECERDILDDIFWLFPNNLYEEIGKYSTYFWFDYEQADFALRAKDKGYRLIYNPLAKIWHKGSPSVGGRDQNPVLAYYSIQGSLIYRYLHLSKITFLQYYLKIVISIFLSFVKSLLLKTRGINNTTYVYAKFKGLMYFNRWLLLKNENSGFNPFKKQ
jgi:GT2 family glycosyltransferase